MHGEFGGRKFATGVGVVGVGGQHATCVGEINPHVDAYIPLVGLIWFALVPRHCAGPKCAVRTGYLHMPSLCVQRQSSAPTKP